MTGPRSAPAPRLRLRLVLVSGRQHPDFDFAFAAAVADHAEVLMLVPEGPPPPADPSLASVRIVTQPWPRHRQILASLLWLSRLRRAIRMFRPDVVHVLSEGQVWLTLLARLIREPVIVTLHDVAPHPGDQETARVPRSIVNGFVRHADGVIVHGSSLQHNAVARLGLSARRVHIVHHPALWRYRRTAQALALDRPDDGVFRMLFFGRVVLYKGLRHLLAAEPMIAPAVQRRLIIAGEGPALAGDLATALDMTRLEVRARRIGPEETADLFTRADVLVLPYIEASQSGVLAIAATFALPVVASRVGELGALVEETGMGLTVPPADPAALAAALSRLALDLDLRRRCAERAEMAARTVLSPAETWRAAEVAYRSVMNLSKA